jgi:hypothetical protein
VLSLVGLDEQPTTVKATVAVKMAVAMRLVTFMMNSLLVEVVLVVPVHERTAVESVVHLPNSAFAAEMH